MYNKQDPKPLNDLLEKLLRKVDPQRNIQQNRVFVIWDDCVGQGISRNAQPEEIERGVLLVKVRSSSWSQQLLFMKDEIKKKLNRELGRSVIKDLRFRIGELDENVKPASPQKPPLPEFPITPDLLREIDKQTAQIEDPELREQIRRTLISAAKRHGEQIIKG